MRYLLSRLRSRAGERHARRARTVAEAGFTLTELLTAVVIVGILSALAMPSLGRDKKANLGGDYADLVVRELQRARIDAVAERLAKRIYVYSDRVEVRSAVPGTRPGQAPRSPTITDAATRTVLAANGVAIYDVVSVATVPGQKNLATGAYRELEFNARGQAQFVGFPAMTGAYLYISNDEVALSHPDSHYRIDLLPLTARAVLRTGWN